MAIGTRLRGILDELIATGYPEQVAERIASGELDMRPGAISERRRDFAPNMETFYHGGSPNIGAFGGKNELGRPVDATFVSDSPMLANTYVGQAGAMDLAGGRQHGQIYPLAVDTRDFLQTDALGQIWHGMENLDVFDPRQGRFIVNDGQPDYSKYRRSFDTDDLMLMAMEEKAPGVVIDSVIDVGPNFRAAKKAYQDNPELFQQFLRLEEGSKVAAINDPSRIRSLFGAAFDPEYKGSNILGFQGGSQSPSLIDAATQSAVGAASMAAHETPEGELYQGLTDKMIDYLTEQMGGSEEDRERAEYISMGMDFLPFIGAAKGVSETFDAYKNDDTLGMALGAGGILAGMIPFGRGAYKSALGIAEETPLRDIDKRFSYQPMDGGNQRKFDMARGQSLDFNVENRPLNIQSDNLSLADFEGRPYIFTQSDRSRAGGILTRVGGQDIEPIDLRGGRDFMFDAPSEGMVWASAPDVVGKLDSTAQKLAKEYGQDPLLLPYSMQPTGIDFSTFPVDAMINTARSGMSKTNIKKLDSKIKKILPDWQGVVSPDSNYAFRTATGDQRKAIMRLIDSDFKDVPGGMSAAEARVVTSDPAQYTTSGGMVTNVGLLDTSKPIYADSGHPTYIAGLAGEGLGRLETPVTIMPQSRLRGRNISDTPTDAELGAAMRSMSMNPAAQIGLIDEEFLRAYYK